MRYTINDKVITIPDAEIEKNMVTLDITRDEAVEMWLSDNDYIENEVVNDLTAKAKENKTVDHGATSAKPRKQVKRERKPDTEKENTINMLAETLKNAGFEVNITNPTKIIEFSIGNNHYKVDLIKQRVKK